MFKDPFIISSIILAISFVFILICNHKLKSKVINISFLILSILFLILIVIFDNNYIYELLKSIITYIWYPNYLLFVSTIFISIIILIYTIFKKKISFLEKIFNYILFGINFSTYIIFLRLDINLDLYSSLYSTPSLVLLRIVSITFIIWVLIILVLKLINKRKLR